MPPRPAREAVTAAALRGDTAALLGASAYLPAREAFRYDRRRAAAFAAALAGERERALTDLGLGGGVRSLRLGLDVAVVELLTRGPAPALAAVGVALRDGFHSESDVPLLLAECVRRDPETTRAALAVALAGGTPLQRVHAAAAVLGAARLGPVEPAIPALAVATLALAVVAFLRLPGLTGGEEAAPPRLQEPRPAVVAARPPERSLPATPPRAPRPHPVEAGTIQIALRASSTRARSGAADAARGTLPTHARHAQRPAAPPPASPVTPVPSPAPASQPAPAVAAAVVVTPTAPPPAESTRQLAAEQPPTKAERKAAKEERKAEKKAAKASLSAAASLPAPAATAAAVGTAVDAASTEETADVRPHKAEKPDKAGKPGDHD